jgi:hypothetical protein
MNIYVMARMTYREGVRQPIFYIVIGVSSILIFMAPLFTLFAFGEEISMLREVGLATITFAGLLIAILSAYLLLTAEIEKLTVLTILSKPIRRSEFIIGKFLGIFYTCFLAMFFLALVFCIVYWLNEGRSMLQTGFAEGRYLNHPELVGQDIKDFMRQEIGLILQGVYFCLLQVMILTSFAIMFSSRLSLILSVLGCFMIFVLGHISTYLVQGLVTSHKFILVLIGRIGALLLPNLTNLNVSSLVADRYPIGLGYLTAATGYVVIYSIIILAIATLLFGRREG